MRLRLPLIPPEWDWAGAGRIFSMGFQRIREGIILRIPLYFEHEGRLKLSFDSFHGLFLSSRHCSAATV
jgi:hypothetical protein